MEPVTTTTHVLPFQHPPPIPPSVLTWGMHRLATEINRLSTAHVFEIRQGGRGCNSVTSMSGHLKNCI